MWRGTLSRHSPNHSLTCHAHMEVVHSLNTQEPGFVVSGSCTLCASWCLNSPAIVIWQTTAERGGMQHKAEPAHAHACTSLYQATCVLI